MKRIISILLILLLIISTFAGCKEETKDVTTDKINDLLSEYYKMLDENIKENSTSEDVKLTLMKWANQNKIKVSYDDYNNVIMSSAATSEEFKDEPSNILHCSVDLDNPETTIRNISIIMYVLQSTENHGFIRAIFTPVENGSYLAAEKIKKNYIKGNNLISLDWDKDNSLLVGSAGASSYSIFNSIQWNPPTFSKSYEISISGLPGGNLGEWDLKQPNPIKIIGDFLATQKSKGVLFELASFNGGISSNTFPSSATAVVLITDNDVKTFTKAIEASIENFNDKYETEFEAIYSYTETEIPDKVISDGDFNNLISFLYTCVNGTYLKSNDGQTIATANIGAISTSTGNLLIYTYARSLDKQILNEMDSVYDTICGLSGMDYECTSVMPVWGNMHYSIDTEEISLETNNSADQKDTENILYNNLSQSMLTINEKEPSKDTTMLETACSIFQDRNKNLNIIGFGINSENAAIQTKILIDYLSPTK